MKSKLNKKFEENATTETSYAARARHITDRKTEFYVTRHTVNILEFRKVIMRIFSSNELG